MRSKFFHPFVEKLTALTKKVQLDSQKIFSQFDIQKIKTLSAYEFVELFWINLKVQIKSILDFCRVIILYYPKFSFAKADFSLLLMYLFHNPYTISKRFLQKKEEKEIYVYGETPLTTLAMIAKEVEISSRDTVFELGCGRGRTCFWLRYFLGCQVVGIEHIPEFVERALKIRNRLEVDKVEFRQEDMLESDFKEASVIYLYGTCYDLPFIQALIKKFHALPAGTKIITVSYSLADYGDTAYEIMKRFPAKFTWGTADVYLNVKK